MKNELAVTINGLSGVDLLSDLHKPRYFNGAITGKDRKPNKRKKRTYRFIQRERIGGVGIFECLQNGELFVSEVTIVNPSSPKALEFYR